MELVASGISETGPYRDLNEDAIGSFAPPDPLTRQRKGHLYIVADGLGGHNAGEVASATAIEAVSQEYYSPANHTRIEPALRQAVQAANLRIHNLAQRNSNYRSMETTLTAVVLAGSHTYVAHIGDCRVYLWREGKLSQLTSDHSEAAELVRMRVLKPERVRDHPGRNVLTRTLGSKLIPRPDYLRHPILPGDRLALCSDGLWSEVDETELSEVLGNGATPEEACRELVHRALSRECLDNLSLQIINVLAVEADPEPAVPRASWLSGIFQRGR